MMIRNVWWRALACVVGGTAAHGTLSQQAVAQRAVAAEQRFSSVATHEAADVMARTVTVQLSGTSIKQAIAAIAANSGIVIQYRSDVLDAYPDAVTVRAVNQPLRAVLDRVLANTSLSVVRMSDDRLAIVEAKPGTRALVGVVVGKIRHAKSGEPVVGATITVDDARKGVLSGDDGMFRLSVAAGAHTVHVRAVGFVKYAQQLTIQDGDTTMVSVALEPSTSVLNEVIVTGTVVATERKAIPTPITVITAAEIEKRGITRLEQFMRGEVPGLVAIESGSMAYGDALGGTVQTSMYSRGSSKLDGSANPIKTYVDGIEILDPSYVGTIDPKSIERIEIITGPQAATIYGSGAMGGVMQIFTKRGSGSARPTATLSVLYGMLQNNFSDGMAPTHTDALTLAGGTGPEFTYSGTLSYNYTGQWQPMLFNRRYGASAGVTHMRGRVTLGGSVSTTAQTNGTYRQSFSNALGYATRLQDGTYFFSGAPPYSSWLSRRISASNAQTTSLDIDIRATSSWQHHLTVGRNQTILRLQPEAPSYSNTPVGGDTLFAVSNSSGQRTTAAYNTTLASAIGRALSSSLTFGATMNDGEQYQFSGCTATTVASSVTGCSSSSAPSVQRTLHDSNWGEFVNWRLGVFEQLYLTVGLRAEQNPAYGRKVKSNFKPTNGVTYTIERGDFTLKLLGSYGHATRAPNEAYRLMVISTLSGYDPAQYVSQFEAPSLRPETSRGPQGGFELYMGNIGSVTLNHYSQVVVDLMQAVPVDSIPYVYLASGQTGYLRQIQYQNVAKVRQFGWEATGSLNLGPLLVKGTYSWNDSRVLAVNPLAGGTVGQSFNKYMTHTGNVTLGYAHGGTSVTLVTNYVGQMPNAAAYYSGFSFDNFYARLPMYVETNRGRSIVIPQPGYTKSDLAASHRLTSSLSATLNVVNMGNTFTSEYGRLNPALGRQTSMGFSLKFPGVR